MLLNIDLRMKMDAKSDKLKDGSKVQVSGTSIKAPEKAKTTLIAFEVCLIIQHGLPEKATGIAPKSALEDLYKDAQKGAPEVKQKNTPHVALELHLFLHNCQCIRLYKMIQ